VGAESRVQDSVAGVGVLNFPTLESESHKKQGMASLLFRQLIVNQTHRKKHENTHTKTKTKTNT